MQRQFLKSYGRLSTSYSEVHFPTSVDEIKQLFVKAKIENRKISFRGGGNSFDSQSLNDDLVINLQKLNKIKNIDLDKKQITVEPGVRWEDMLQQLLPSGLTPYVVVTTGKATAGGTLSGNCLSRSSPVFGKAGKHIERLSFLSLNGELIECSRAENPELFLAIIGGFGYLGAVVEITYNLLEIGAKIQVRTVANKFESFEDLIENLIKQTHAPGDWNAIYSVAFFSGKKNKGVVFRSKYTDEIKLKRLLIHRPKNLLRIPIEWLSRFSVINNLVWNLIFKYFIKENDAYIDELGGYTFFMDGNRRAKEVGEFLGFTMEAIQQTFVIPEARVVEFLNTTAQLLREQKLTPNLFDILFVPADDILMSSNNGLSGFAVSLAFEDLSKKKIAKLHFVLKRVNQICHDLGGRVYLVKNVVAAPDQIEAMYGENLRNFLTLKKHLDPDGILKNEFFDRLFCD